MDSRYSSLALEYFSSVHASSYGSVDGEPEAQLTTPVANLFSRLVDVAGLGHVHLVRESRLDRVRPDFAVLHTIGKQTHQKGYIELKAPGVTVDASLWAGRNAKQWETMSSEAEILIVCNGRQARLYHDGEPFGQDADLPYSSPETWDPSPLVQLLRRFLEARLTPVTSVNDLSRRLAVRTADLRDRLLFLLESEGEASEAVRGGFESWKAHVHPESTQRDFADGVSQVIGYGMVLAALSTSHPDADDDGYISVSEARDSIRSISPVMAAAFAPLVDKPVLFHEVQVELGALETLVSAINRKRVNRSADRRGDPWLYFYEDFLSVYDPDERRQAGVYYTPIAVVRAMVRIVDHLLVDRFGIRLGFADQKVVTLDPATGTGTFPLAVIDRAAERLEEIRGPAGVGQAAERLARNLYAFELLPGAYSVAHLRLSQRLKELSPSFEGAAQVVLTDTLESPLDPQVQLSLFGDAEVLAAEQNRAKRIKLQQQVTVVIGNPPYRRVSRDIQGRGSGGWVLEGKVPGRRGSKSLFDDILDVARQHTIFSHQASLYNLYVYFWRWAIWKAFEAHGDGPGVVAFITGSSWLRGPGFVGLRKVVREVCDEAWVIDLGGDNKGASPEENVFAIETPVSVVILSRKDKTDRSSPAPVHYRRITGSASDKLSAMEAIASSDLPLEGDWLDSPDSWLDSFIPPTGAASWQDMPLLSDIFPWQQPGCMHSRAWPIAPHPDLLKKRWDLFVSSDLEKRPDLYVTPASGRNIHTQVRGLPKLVNLKAGSAPEPMVRFGYRSFDRQWTFDDPRLAKTESPALWASISSKQVFLVSLMTAGMSGGPGMTATECVPDKHFFRGSFGGKDVMPLYRDEAAVKPNITGGLPTAIGKELGITRPRPEDLAAYVYAVLSSPRYQHRFADELKTPGPRVPITGDAGLWSEAVRLGKELLWLHTFAERFQNSGDGRGAYVPVFPGVGWSRSVTQMPESMADISYDADKELLDIGDGQVSGVQAAVWGYSVSGMQVLKKWLGYRTAKGAGRTASSKNPLDQIRPQAWPDEWNDELLDLIRVLTLTVEKQPKQADLVDRICDGPLIDKNRLPVPKAAERKPPK